MSEALQTTWMRDALAWFNGPRKQEPASPDDKPVYKWLWEAIQGDFNDDRSTGQIAFDAGISMIRGTLPEAAAVSLMMRRKPAWLTKDGAASFLYPPRQTMRKSR